MKSFNPECWYKDVCDGYKDDCELNCRRYIYMRYLMENSNIPVNKRKPIPLTPSDCDYEAFMRLADIKSDMTGFVENGRNLYLTSTVTGNGKTSWALKLLMRYFEEVSMEKELGVHGVFVHVPTFLFKCKNFTVKDLEFEQFKKHLLGADLVVWDDIASTDITGYDVGQLLAYISARSFEGLSNIYTGNIADKNLMEKSLGVKITSRIWNSHTEVIEFFGGDRR